MSKTKYQVLARRYRPQVFHDVVGQEAIVTTLKNAIKFDKVAHAYLFCGSRGVGKTTLARLFAKALNCQERTGDLEPCNQCSSCLEIAAGQSLDVIEIDGASNRGIDDIRQINDTVAYAPSQGSFKIYIIDEVHMLTKEAFNALLKTLEEPPEKAKFFFATTEPHKVLPTIISRCQRFDLGRIPLTQIVSKLEQIAIDLKREVEPAAFHLIASFSSGSLRDAESLFDQILCFAEGVVTADEIRKALGLISQDHFFQLDIAFSECKTVYAFDLVESLFSAGKDLNHFLEQLIEHVRLLTLAKTMGEKGLKLPDDMASKYLESARFYTSAQCLYLLDYLLKAEQQIQKSSSPRVSLEATLLHYIQSKNRIPVEVLVRKLAELEEKMKGKGGVSLESEPESVQPTQSKPLEPVLKAEPIAEKKPEIAVVPPVVVIEKPVVPEPILKAEPIVTVEKPIVPVAVEAPAPLKKPKPASLPQEAKAPPPAKPTPTEPAHHMSHYDTLIRFAAVELEGTVKK